MIENTQDMRAYHFMKNIDTGDHDLLIRLITDKNRTFIR